MKCQLLVRDFHKGHVSVLLGMRVVRELIRLQSSVCPETPFEGLYVCVDVVPRHPVPDTTLVCFMGCYLGLQAALRVIYPFLCPSLRRANRELKLLDQGFAAHAVLTGIYLSNICFIFVVLGLSCSPGASS